MWKEVWVVMLVLAFMCLAISILLMFIWDIPNLIDELSGRKAKRQIRMLHELNSSTSTFDKLSTNEIYSGISSGTLLSEELSSTCEEEVKNCSSHKIGNPVSESVGQDLMSYTDDEEDGTSFIEGELDDSTSYLDSLGDTLSSNRVIKDLKISVIEEQSSL